MKRLATIGEQSNVDLSPLQLIKEEILLLLSDTDTY